MAWILTSEEENGSTLPLAINVLRDTQLRRGSSETMKGRGKARPFHHSVSAQTETRAPCQPRHPVTEHQTAPLLAEIRDSCFFSKGSCIFILDCTTGQVDGEPNHRHACFLTGSKPSRAPPCFPGPSPQTSQPSSHQTVSSSFQHSLIHSPPGSPHVSSSSMLNCRHEAPSLWAHL